MKSNPIMIGLAFGAILILAFAFRLLGGFWLFCGAIIVAIIGGGSAFMVLCFCLRKQRGRRWIFVVIAAVVSVFFARGLFQELMAVHVVILHPPNTEDTIVTFDNRIAVMVSESNKVFTADAQEKGFVYGRRMTPGNKVETLRYSVVCGKPGTIEASVGTNTLKYIKARRLVINGQVSEISRFWFFPSERPFLL